MSREVTLTRRVSFSSGHRYWRGDLSAVENKNLFGDWASPYNHGHNYILDVSTTGIVDVESAMVINIKTIDDILQERIVSRFDQKSINDEIEAFANVAPSLENLLQYFAYNLSDLPKEVQLTGLRLEEMPRLWGEWHARDPQMIQLTRTYEFAASHRLDAPGLSHEKNIELFGKCNNANGHGHNYVLEVTVAGVPDTNSGMVVDLGQLDQVVHAEIVDRYDHKNLNLDLPEFEGKNTTSELVALAIFDRLAPKTPARLARVRLWETARNMFEVVASS
ncbi:MAG: 6-carboxytetrahydropterin synthase [Armatimonadetes bacterium]|nr:6-carboxytetrahydropterin synthase [Armatimonadota bacterium]